MTAKISALVAAAAVLAPSAAFAHPGHAIVAMVQSNASAALVLGGFAAILVARAVRMLRDAGGRLLSAA